MFDTSGEATREMEQSTKSIGTDLRNLWYGFVGKGTINKVDWNEGSTSPTDLAGRAKQGCTWEENCSDCVLKIRYR